MSPLSRDLLHDFRRICEFVAFFALLANFLPKADCFERWPKFCGLYVVFIDLVAGFALNWRHCLPSLDLEFLGFLRRPPIRRVPRVR